MERPSGECEGQPCYTVGDRAAINAEIAVCQAELIVLQAEANAKMAALMVLQMEKMDALMSPCAC
jgi:hypothetical protein